MQKELLEIDPEGISAIRDQIDDMISTNRLYKFRQQIMGQIEAVFNALFGHVFKYPKEFLKQQVDFAKIPAWTKQAREFVESSIRPTSTFVAPPWPPERLCKFYSPSMIRDVIVPAIVSDIRDEKEEKFQEVMLVVIESVENEKKRLFRNSIESQAGNLCDFFFRGSRGSGNEVANYALDMLKQRIRTTALWEFPPSPAKMNEIEFTSEYMNGVIVPSLQDELASSGIMHLVHYFIRRKPDRVDVLNRVISSCVEPLIRRMVKYDDLNDLIAESHPLLRDGLDVVMRAYIKDLRPRIVAAIRGSEYFREIGSRDAFAWRDDISDSYSIVDSDSESQIDFNADETNGGDEDEAMISGQNDQEDDDVSESFNESGCHVRSRTQVHLQYLLYP
jgi:hypothetical protein